MLFTSTRHWIFFQSEYIFDKFQRFQLKKIHPVIPISTLPLFHNIYLQPKLSLLLIISPFLVLSLSLNLFHILILSIPYTLLPLFLGKKLTVTSGRKKMFLFRRQFCKSPHPFSPRGMINFSYSLMPRKFRTPLTSKE